MNYLEDGYLLMKNITKIFDAKHALSNVELKVKLGSIHGILGENGAGKSVLMRILSGSLGSDFGSIFINGEHFVFRQPVDALKKGIITIYQEISLASELSVAENLFLGRLPRYKFFPNINWKKLYEMSNEILEKMHFEIDPRKKVSDLNFTQKRMVEIAKALVNNVKILVVDESYVGLAEYEQKHFLDVLRQLNADGVTILYISHNIDEVISFCDYFTVIRDGKNVVDFKKGDLSKDEIIRVLVGGLIKNNFPRIISEKKRLILKVEELKTPRGINDVSFGLYKGEIMGIAGLVGSGRTAVARALFGLDKILKGKILLNNTAVTIRSPGEAIQLGFGYLPEDMLKESLNTNFSVSENITMANIKEISNAVMIDKKKELNISREFIKKLLIKTPSIHESVANLSQGNQQKVHFSKWVHANCNILILDEPTNGIDVCTKIDIYNYMNNYVLKGNSIILISSNLEELIGMCDRILILREGTVAACLDRAQFSKETIIKFASE